MKNRGLFLCGLALILGGLISCGGGQKASPSGEVDTGPVTIRFWHMDDSGVRQEAINAIIDDFNNLHEGEIVVEALAVNFWDYWDKISVSMSAQEEPDIFLHDLGNVGRRAETGAIMDLSAFLAQAGMVPDELYFSAPLEMCRHDEGLYALPYETDVRLLFYNREMLAEAGYNPDRAPESWDELWKIGKDLTVEFDDGTYDRMGLNILLPQSYFLTYVWGTGADYLDNEGQIKVNSPGVIDALVEWKAMVDSYGHQKMQKFASEFGGGAADPFIVEKLAMTIGVPDFYSQIKKYNPELDFGYCQVPYPAGPTSWSNGFSLEMSSRSDHPGEAFQFMQYLMSTEVQKQKAVMSSALITNKEAATDDELMADPFWAEVVRALENTHFRPFRIQSPAWYDHMNKSVEEVVYGKKTPKEALDHAQKMIENDIKKYEMTH